MQRVTSFARDTILHIAGRLRHTSRDGFDDTLLILQPDHLGDILLSQPAVQHIRDSHPGSRLIAIVGPWSNEIASIAWPIDEIVTLSFPGFARTTGGSPIDPYLQLRSEARRLEQYRARAAFILRPDAWWAAWLASLVTPEVVTADDPRSRLFATRVVPISDGEHAALRSLRISEGGEGSLHTSPSSRPLRLPISRPASHDAHSLLHEIGVSDEYLVIHPSSGAAVKEWPSQRWRAVAQALVSPAGKIVLTGSPAEVELCAAIAEEVPGCVSVAGQTSVPVLAELLRGAVIVLGPDCGPLHLAVAVGTPTIHLFGPSDPRRYGPWGNPTLHRVISAGWHCPRCGDLSPARGPGCGCMLAIQPDDVIAVARSVLSTHAR